PAFEEQYATDAGPARSPASDETVTIGPPASTNAGSAAWQSRNAPVRLVAITRFHRSSVWSRTAPPAPAPELITSASSRPKCSRQAPTARPASDGSVTSA